MPNARPGGSNNLRRATGGVGDQFERPEGSVREGVERVGQRMRESYECAGEAVTRGYQSTRSLVGHYPAPSLLIGFGLGFGLGMMLTMAVAKPQESWWRREWRLPDSLRHLQDRLVHHS